MVRNNVVIIVAKGAGWDSDSVSLAAFKKNLHTPTHTHTVWEKNAPYRGTAVWVAGEDGRMTLAMLQARGQSMTQQCGNIFTHLQMCLSPLDRIKPTLMDAAWNKNLERINSDL